MLNSPGKKHTGLDVALVRRTVTLAWPISIQLLTSCLLGIADVYMVSQLGETPLAAAGICNKIVFFLMVVLSGVFGTVGIFASQFAGAAQTHKIAQVVRLSFSAAIPVVVLLASLSYVFWEEILSFGTRDIEVKNLARHYLWVSVCGFLFLAPTAILESVMRGLGETKLPMRLNMLTIFTNIALNYWFIYGGLGVPALGVTGAALGTVTARLLQMTAMLIIFKRWDHKLWASIKRPVAKHSIDRGLFWDTCIPITLGTGVWALGTLMYHMIYGLMGTSELAAMSLLEPIFGLIISIFLGIAMAGSVSIGQFLGADKYRLALSTANSLLVFIAFITVLFGGLLYLLRENLFVAFGAISSTVLAHCYDVFLVFCCVLWLKALNMMFSIGILRTGGDSRSCLYIDTIGLWLVSLPLCYVVAFVLKLDLIWVVVATVSEEIVKVMLFAWRMRQLKWLKNIGKPRNVLLG